MKKALLIIPLCLLLTACSAPLPGMSAEPTLDTVPTPAESAVVSQMPAPTAVEETQAPALTGEVSRNTEWALASNGSVYYISNEGFSRVNADGTQETCLDAGDPLLYRSIHLLPDGRILLTKRLDTQAETDLYTQHPTKMAQAEFSPAVYTLYLYSPTEDKLSVLKENLSYITFISPTQVLALQVDAECQMCVLDLTTGALTPIAEQTFAEKQYIGGFVANNVYYFYTLAADQDWDARSAFALDLTTYAVTPVEQSALPDQSLAQNFLPDTDLQAQSEQTTQSTDHQVYTYTYNGQSYTVTLDMDAEYKTAQVVFYQQGDTEDLPPLTNFEIRGLYANFDAETVLEKGEIAFLNEQEAASGSLYCLYLEDLSVTFSGGWAFIYDNDYTNDVIGGPIRLIQKVKLQ